MTELQSAIGHLKETISVGNVLLAKMETKQEDLDKPKVPVFPNRFTVVRDSVYPNSFIIGLKKDGTIFRHWDELPPDFEGRAIFDQHDLREIIKGLQTLLGESNG